MIPVLQKWVVWVGGIFIFIIFNLTVVGKEKALSAISSYLQVMEKGGRNENKLREPFSKQKRTVID